MKEKIYNIVIKILVTLFGRRFVYAIRYYRLRQRWPNFNQPQDLSEYLINKITTNQTHSYAPLADKIEVRQYVASKGLSSILLPHYGYWSNAHDINFDTLPPKFVLKTNNGVDSQNVYICRDKSTFDIPSVCKKLNKALKEKSVYEYHYNLIKPQILCEQLLETRQGTQPTDYKFLCINGKVVDIIATIGRFFTPAMMGYYSQSRKLESLATHTISTAVSQVSFPVMSQFQHDNVKMQNAFCKYITLLAYVTMPLMSIYYEIIKKIETPYF